MNRREVSLFSRIQECLHIMASMSPYNPCDTKAKFAAHDAQTEASKHLYLSISMIGHCDYLDADQRIALAESCLEAARVSIAKGEA